MALRTIGQDDAGRVHPGGVEEAFEKVRGYVVQVAALAAQGDLDGIEAFKGFVGVFTEKSVNLATKES